MAETSHIVVATGENFAAVVLEASHQHPVVVDFWAEWCAPCRMLMPVLAKLAEEYGGKFTVAKVNTEEERDLAARFGIRSLPTVQIFKGGTAVDQFMGALPEAQVRAFLERHVPRESDALLAQADGLIARGDPAAAAPLIAQALEIDPAYPRAILADAKLKAQGGKVEEARKALDRLPPDEHGKPEVSSLRGRLAFAAVASGAPTAEMLQRTLAAAPGDSEARYQLAARKVMEEDYAGALELLLGLMLKDRSWGGDAGRKGMLQIFDILGGTGDLVARFRGRMFNALH